jgi:WD40 repeat protein/uncharacterized caspase-like protein
MSSILEVARVLRSRLTFLRQLGWLLWLAATLGAAAQQRPELSVQTGHALTLTSVALSGDGKLLASGGEDRVIKLWDTAAGLELRTLTGHAGAVSSVALTPDGQLLASASADKTAKLWDVAAGTELRTITSHTAEVHAVAFSPDGKTLATGSFDATIKLWDVNTGKELRTLAAAHRVFVVTFSPDGRTLVSGGSGGAVKLWDITTGKELRRLAAHAEAVQALALSRDGRTLATGSADEKVKLWDVGTGRELRVFSLHTNDPMAGMVLSVAFSPDGQTVAAGTLVGAVKLWRVADGREVRAWPAHFFATGTLIYSPDGRTLTTGGGDQTVKQWDVTTGTQLKLLAGRSDPVAYLTVSGDGRTMASSRHDAPVKLWRLGSSTDLRTIVHKGVVISLALDDTGRLLATGSGGTIKLWDTATGQELRTLEAHASPTHALAMSGDGRLVASGAYEPVVKLWDAATGRELHALNAHADEGRIEVLRLSRDGRVLVSSGGEHAVKVWDAESGRELRNINASARVINLALSPDARALVTAGLEGETQLWDVTTGELRATLADARAPLAFSNDGRTFLTSRRAPDSSATLMLRDAATGRELRSFTSRYRVTAPAFFCADDRLLITGSGDTRIVVWDVATGRELVSLINVDEADWIAVTPDGLFDGTPPAWARILWRFSPRLRDVAPVEVFFNEFFYPGLLAEVLAGQRPQARADVAQKDRRQPQVQLALADPVGAQVTAPYVNIKIDVTETPNDETHAQGSGARDVRLFRDGALVKVWRGDVLAGQKSVTLTERVPIVAGPNRFTAYAFNREDVKSADATLAVVGADSLKRDATLYVLNVGVNTYANPAFNLRYAVADAEEFGRELARQQGRLGRYKQTVVVTLLNAEATKANVLLAIKRLVETETAPLPPGVPAQLAQLKYANPEDGVAIYFAGHGTAQGQRFYLIPHDLGYAGQFGAIDAAGLQTLLAHSISDRELEAAFERLNAGQLLLVLDACNSGQALEAEEKRRGPMNSKGLAQLAYEKGMYILTAAQSFQAAQEAAQLGHGLLTYALVEEGLKQALADAEPKDGLIVLREWLEYATARVPLMQVDKMKAAQVAGRNLSFAEDERGLDAPRRSGQRPRVFYRHDFSAPPLVVAQAGTQPGK